MCQPQEKYILDVNNKNDHWSLSDGPNNGQLLIQGPLGDFCVYTRKSVGLDRQHVRAEVAGFIQSGTVGR